MLYTGGGSVSNNHLKIMSCTCLHSVCISVYKQIYSHTGFVVDYTLLCIKIKIGVVYVCT